MCRNYGTKAFPEVPGRLMVVLALIVILLPISSNSGNYTFKENWNAPGFTLLSQSSAQVEIVFSMHNLEVVDVNINGETMQGISIPGVILPHAAGAPDLPTLSKYIALPQGARARVEILGSRTEVIHNLNIAPAFDLPVDTSLAPLHFEKNPAIYNLNALYPPHPVILSPPLKMRGVDAVILSLTPFQYNPFTKDLIVYKDIRLRLTFSGGNGHFGEDRLRSRWWDPVLQANLLNYASLPAASHESLPVISSNDNYEYLIITPNDPVFLAWADTLRRWRSEQGIRTSVVTLSQIGGNDTTLIENYINNAYNNWKIPPVAVLLLSDYQSSGMDQYGISSAIFCNYVTDNKFADVDGDYLPDLNIARVCAQNGQQLQTMIGKMLTYERYPTTNPAFYQHPVMVGGYQSITWFILCTEVVYGFLHNVKGLSPLREYAICDSLAGPLWSTNVNTYMILDYFGPGGLNYIPATPQYLTDWGGNASRINRDINNGTFMMLYRDHGTPGGWNVPLYSIADVNNLTNTLYPYVFSIGCQTGRYDYPSICFAEAMHRSQHGALGINAASGATYSFCNDTYVWGMMDYLWPNFDPGSGAALLVEPNLMPGFASVSGKYYLEASSWPWNPSGKWFTHQYYHHFGDAFMTMYSQPPLELAVYHDSTIAPGADLFAVNAEEGSLIGLSVNGALIASVQGIGVPRLIPISPLSAGQALRVTVTKADHYRYSKLVPVRTVGPSGISLSLAPMSNPIQIPSNGGNFDFYVIATNSNQTPKASAAWSTILLPNGKTYGPISLLDDLTLPPGSSARQRRQNIPGSAPPGLYTYKVFVGSYPNVVWDQASFTFTKLTSGAVFAPSPASGSDSPFCRLKPNPFNHVTVISYQLSAFSQVSLRVYDTAGRLVSTLLEGRQEPGAHEVIFDGSKVSSGLYFARVQAGEVTTVLKMLLLK